MPPRIAHPAQGARPSCRAFVYVVTAASLDLAGKIAGTLGFAELIVCAEAPMVRAIKDQIRKSFVLSRINRPQLRAFADQCVALIRAFTDQ